MIERAVFEEKVKGRAATRLNSHPVSAQTKAALKITKESKDRR
jgi:hypothetical protein